ncbi:hypothetical protein Y032_0021g341 [Ancylostoma ceylanicum]|uniref:Uncharacterized protein n=1 Tax=Ancylostoma ceylanicum TaxID=53326 RepID=A0A016V078_9BILA|nr:hypothetical protein Y032_0021g341 [Ancylostoma ceylanicum]
MKLLLAALLVFVIEAHVAGNSRSAVNSNKTDLLIRPGLNRKNYKFLQAIAAAARPIAIAVTALGGAIVGGLYARTVSDNLEAKQR